MCKMQQQLEVLHARTRAHPIEGENGFENEDKEHTVARQRLEKVRLQAAAVNRRIAVEQRRLDSMPSQIEINQYQRRIIELYNQMAAKHRETKQFYTLHNTLIDVKTYMQREIDLLNSIDDVQQLTSKETYKDSFIENLENVLKGVDATLDKVRFFAS
ncbi:Coiled-coil domain-containing protein 93 [Toxocara canis]|uniref:Coiled-coil domain-containing protein 93 n=1 Tax=Toxocara canis TaxID=6265 RepID=A0A0B2UQH7_TOXCA|nr:Coiled-coil domain-containing protein 93 [Toxocara canis]